jgi:hypothetical protein
MIIAYSNVFVICLLHLYFILLPPYKIPCHLWRASMSFFLPSIYNFKITNYI